MIILKELTWNKKKEAINTINEKINVDYTRHYYNHISSSNDARRDLTIANRYVMANRPIFDAGPIRITDVEIKLTSECESRYTRNRATFICTKWTRATTRSRSMLEKRGWKGGLERSELFETSSFKLPAFIRPRIFTKFVRIGDALPRRQIFFQRYETVAPWKPTNRVK